MSTISPPAVLLGSQVPQIQHLPPDVASLAGALEAIELADRCGMSLDESQQFMLRAALGERADHTWAAFEVCDIEPRQNGKGDTIQARELAGLFLFGEDLIIHTAHEFATANEAFLRMASIVESNEQLRRKVQRIRFGNGEQGIELKSGQRLKYRARTGGAGRGFAGASLVVYDEAYALQAEHVAASLPTLSTHPNPQVWFASSAGLSHSTALWSLRKRAIRGNAGRLAYCEHTAEDVSIDTEGRVVSMPIDLESDANVALANPAYGVRISADYIDAERRAMEPDKFARERLGVWDPLDGDEHTDPKIPGAAWAATAIDPSSAPPPVEGMTIAFDVAKDGEWSSIAVGIGSLADHYVEVIEHRAGTSWLPDRLVELVERWRPAGVGCNGAGPAGAQVGPILAAFTEAGLDADLLRQLNSREYQQACGGFYTAVTEFVDWPGAPARPRLRRTEQPALDDAVRGAGERPLGDAWVWDFRNATTPISPLVAVTIARALLPIEAVVLTPPMIF